MVSRSGREWSRVRDADGRVRDGDSDCVQDADGHVRDAEPDCVRDADGCVPTFGIVVSAFAYK